MARVLQFLGTTALLLATLVAHAECEVDKERTATAKTKDGSTLTLVTKLCDGAVSEELIIHERRGKRTGLIRHVPDGSSHTGFSDLNDDGFHEIFIGDTCGMANCDTNIYSFDPSSLKVRRILRANLANIEKVGNYFVSMERIAGYGEYIYSGFKIMDFDHLRVAQQPSFTLHSYHDFKADKNICRLSMGSESSNSALVKELTMRYCPEGFTIRRGRK